MKKIIVITILSVVVVGLLGIASIYAFLIYPSYTLPPEHLTSPLPSKYGQVLASKDRVYLIQDVSVIPMNQDTVLAHQFVLIEKGIIKQITNSADSIDRAFKPFIIDGKGKYLMPGLTDMHVHLNDDNNLLLLVANGVTTVRDMWGHPFHLQLKENIQKEEILGPTLYTASPVLEGPAQSWPNSMGLNTPTEAREAVIQFKKSGYDFIKIYHTLTQELYTQVLRTSDSIHIPVVGHMPIQVELNKTLSLNQYSLEHIDLGQLRKISPSLPLETKAAMIGEAKKWICPTLIVHKNIQRQADDPSIQTHYEQFVDSDTRKFWQYGFTDKASEYELQKKLAGIMFHSGAKLLSGTDCLNSYVLPGFSLHEELQELVKAGLPTFEALKTSTVHAAEFLNSKQEGGTIEVGKIADLLLLEGNPLQDIRNTRKIRGVMIKGKWFNIKELEDMLRDVKESYAK